MKLFKSHDPNTFHYTTSVCHRRVPVFKSNKACELFIEALAETRRRLPLKLIGYVIMPDGFAQKVVLRLDPSLSPR